MKSSQMIENAYEGWHRTAHLVGMVPFFHDVEIVNLNLFRRAPSTLSTHSWNMTQEVDARGYVILEKHTVVTSAIDDIVDLQLDRFSHQNDIDGLEPAPRSAGPVPSFPLHLRLVIGGLGDRTQALLRPQRKHPLPQNLDQLRCRQAKRLPRMAEVKRSRAATSSTPA
jgi:hypothetical protein